MAFFILLSPNHLYAIEKPSTEWEILLHFHANTFQIKDPTFFINDIPSSPTEELHRTLNLLTENTQSSQDFVCRFPARYNWIKINFTSMLQDQETPSLEKCDSYQEYLEKVPVEKIYLVFAAENISSPLSMMGHVFLMLEGSDENGIKRQHAFSYFAVINSLNPLSLVIESLFTGQEGRFGLSPYQQSLLNYTEAEGRSVWEYELKTTTENRALIRDHIFELRDIKPNYLFTHYNCATFIYDLSTLIVPDLNNKRSQHLWITPRDLVKDLINLNAFDSETVFINPIQAMKLTKWNIQDETKRLNALDLKNTYKIKSLTNESPYDHTYIRYLNEFLYIKNKISHETYTEIKNLTASEEYSTHILPKPEKSPNDTQVSFGFNKIASERNFTISFMPASHKLLDSSEGFFTENSLELGSFELSFNNKALQLENLTIYGVKNINTIDPHVKNLSWGWRISLDRDEPIQQKRDLMLNSQIGAGVSFDLNQNIIVYNLNYLGTYLNPNYGYLYLKPKVGLITNISNTLKMDINTSIVFNKSESAVVNYAGLSLKINKKLSAVSEITKTTSSNQSTDKLNFRVVRYF